MGKKSAESVKYVTVASLKRELNKLKKVAEQVVVAASKEWIDQHSKGNACSACGGTGTVHNRWSWSNGWPEWSDCSSCATVSEEVRLVRKENGNLPKNIEEVKSDGGRELSAKIRELKNQIRELEDMRLVFGSQVLLLVDGKKEVGYVLDVEPAKHLWKLTVKVPALGKNVVTSFKNLEITVQAEDERAVVQKSLREELAVLSDWISEVYGLAGLEPIVSGTQKQNQWAEAIRLELFEKFKSEQDSLRKEFGQKSAKWTASQWIDNRDMTSL
jgi:hypothetical protein